MRGPWINPAPNVTRNTDNHHFGWRFEVVDCEIRVNTTYSEVRDADTDGFMSSKPIICDR